MLNDLLLDLGYSEENIILLNYAKELSQYTELEKYDKINDVFGKLLFLGYSNAEIVKMTLLVPAIYCLSSLDIEKRYNFLFDLGYSSYDIKKMIKNNSRILVLKESQIEEIIITLENFGYSNEEIIEMTLIYPWIFNDVNEVKEKYNNILSLGFDNASVNSITKKSPILYGYRHDEFCKKISYLEEIGFSLSTILKLSLECDFFNYTLLDDLRNRIIGLKMVGFSDLELSKMVDMFPNLLLYSTGDIIEKIQFLISLGYSYCLVLKMVRENSLIFSNSSEMIKMKLDLFYEYNYSFLEIKDMTVKCPLIYNISVDELILKLEFFKSYKLDKIIIDNPEYLMVPVDIIYSRYKYLTSKGIKVSYKDYSMLFMDDIDFSSKYDVNMEDVIIYFKDNNLLSSYMKRKIKRKND